MYESKEKYYYGTGRRKHSVARVRVYNGTGKIGTDEVLNFEVSGEKIQAVHMLPGYTHNIINLSENFYP